MAADNLAAINSALAQTFAPTLVRAWNRKTFLLENMRVIAGGGQGAGKNVGWDVEFSGATADAFAEGSDVSGGEFSADPIVPATLNWGMYRSAFSLTNLEMNVAYANPGNATELEKILEERFFGAATKITSRINQDIIAGTGTSGGNPTIVGLIPALAATGTYAGINKATYTEWAGNVSANGGVDRALTSGILASAEQLAFTASGTSPELIVATPGLYTKYESLFQATQRTVTDGASPGGVSYGTQGATVGLSWRGKPVQRDKDMTAKTLIGVHPDGVELRILPWAPMPQGVNLGTMGQLLSSNGDQTRALGSFLKIYPLAVTGSAVKFAVEIYCQLKVRRPNEHFLIQDLSEV